MAAKKRKAAARVEAIDSSYLESLIGYNARRASLAVIEVFMQRMRVYDLRPVDFSVLSLVTHNPGITSRQLCATLGIQPPNLVAMVNTLEARGLITREDHPNDARAMGLHLTRAGRSSRAMPSARWPAGGRGGLEVVAGGSEDADAPAQENLSLRVVCARDVYASLRIASDAGATLRWTLLRMNVPDSLLVLLGIYAVSAVFSGCPASASRPSDASASPFFRRRSRWPC